LDRFHGRVGFSNPVRQEALTPLSTKPLPAVGDSLGFKDLVEHFPGSLTTVFVSDQYGLALPRVLLLFQTLVGDGVALVSGASALGRFDPVALV